MMVIASKADTITLSLTNAGSASFEVPSNVVAQVVHTSCGNFSQGQASTGWGINISINGRTGFYPPNYNSGLIPNPPLIVGPAIITLTNGMNGYLALCSIQTSPATSTLNFTPSTSVVIPNDNGGPVTIVLESSVDLVNWTSAFPGTYGTTSTNRFFRVRATR